MGHRTVKRVPMDFDWPKGKVWSGYLMPEDMWLPVCTACDGEGYSPAAWAIAHTFYSHQIGGPNAKALEWCDKLGQAEVDHLVEQGRLRVWRDGTWNTEPRTAAEVNANGPMLHDAINRIILVRFRCDRLGIDYECSTCDGHGNIGTPEERQAKEEWTGSEPPTGDGWQLWETVSEGSPVSPVFSTAEELARWAEPNATVFADERTSREHWLRMFLEDSTDNGSLLIARPGFFGVLVNEPS